MTAVTCLKPKLLDVLLLLLLLLLLLKVAPAMLGSLQMAQLESCLFAWKMRLSITPA